MEWYNNSDNLQKETNNLPGLIPFTGHEETIESRRPIRMSQQIYGPRRVPYELVYDSTYSDHN